MNAALTKVLLAAAGLLVMTLGMGWFSGPARGLALCSSGILGLLACRVMRRRQEPEQDSPAVGDPALMCPPEAAARQSCGVTVLDCEYRVLWCDALSAAHLGIQAGTDIGRPIGRIVRESLFASYIAAGDFSQPLRLKATQEHGKVLSLWLVHYLDSQWLLLTVDVTRDAEIEIARRDCVADALHELSSPITMLAGTVDAMRGFAFGPRRLRDSLDSMEEQCRRLQRTVESLLNLSALESAPQSPCNERIDIRAILTAVRAEVEALSAGRHHIVLDAAGGFDLTGSGGEIESAFRNLACNAVRYTPPGGEIRLTWRAVSAEGAEFSVEDNGIGIAREHIPRLTERFYRVDGCLSRKTTGTGLGLAIVNDVLTRHQANLEIDSEPGRGSRFTAKFPAHRVVPAGESGASAAARNMDVRPVLQSSRKSISGEGMSGPNLNSMPSRMYGRVSASTAARPRRGR